MTSVQSSPFLDYYKQAKDDAENLRYTHAADIQIPPPTDTEGQATSPDGQDSVGGGANDSGYNTRELGSVPVGQAVSQATPGQRRLAGMIPFAGVLPDLAETSSAYFAAKRYQNGQETPEDIKTIELYRARIKQQANSSFGSKVLDTVAEFPAFAGEIALTGGLANVGKKIAFDAAEKAAGHAIERTLLTRIGAGMVGESVRTFATPHRIALAGLQSQMPDIITGDTGKLEAVLAHHDDGFFGALAKGYGDTYVEFATEQFGKAIELSGVKAAVVSRWLHLKPGRTLPDLYVKLAEKTGWHGVIDEMLEERLGEVVKPLIGVQDKYQPPTLQQLLVEAAAFSVPGAAGHALGRIAGVHETSEEVIRRAEDHTLAHEALKATMANEPGYQPSPTLPKEPAADATIQSTPVTTTTPPDNKTSDQAIASPEPAQEPAVAIAADEYSAAKQILDQHGYPSVAMLQRRLGLGYSRSQALVDQYVSEHNPYVTETPTQAPAEVSQSENGQALRPIDEFRQNKVEAPNHPLAKFMVAAANQRGVAVHFSDASVNHGVEAIYDHTKGEVWINTSVINQSDEQSQRRAGEVIYHELAHHLEAIDPQAASELRGIIGEATLKAAGETYLKDYADVHFNGDVEAARAKLGEDNIKKEALARSIERGFSEQMASATSDQRAGLIIKLRNALKKLIEKLGLRPQAKSNLVKAFDKFLNHSFENPNKPVAVTSEALQSVRPSQPGSRLHKPSPSEQADRVREVGIFAGKRLAENWKTLQSASEIRDLVKYTISLSGLDLDYSSVKKIAVAVAKDSVDAAGKFDATNFEKAATDILSVDAAVRHGAPVSKTINDSAGVNKPDNQVSERAALKAAMSRSAKAARRAYIQATREGTLRLRQALSDLRAKVMAKNLSIDDYRRQLSEHIRNNVPEKLAGKMLSDIRDIKTFGGLLRGVHKLAKIMDRYDRRLAIKKLTGLINSFDVNKLRPQFAKKMQQVLGASTFSDLSQDGRGRLWAIVDFARKNPINQLPSDLLEQASLGLVSLNNTKATGQTAFDRSLDAIDTGQITALSNTVEHILHLNKTANRMVVLGQERRRDQVQKSALSEVKSNKPGPAKAKFREAMQWLRRVEPDTDYRKSFAGHLLEMSMDADTMTTYMGPTWNTAYQDIKAGYSEYSRSYFTGVDALHKELRAQGFEPGSDKLADWEQETVDLLGHQVRRSQRMELAAMALDTETFDEIVKDGIKSGFKQTSTIMRFTTSELVRFLGSLDPKELAIVQAMRGFINGPMKDQANRRSLDRMGFLQFTNPSYWHRARAMEESDRGADPLARNFRDATIEGLGMFRSRKGSQNPIKLGSVFATFQQTLHQMSVYANLSEPIRNFMELQGDPDINKAIIDTYGTQRLSTLTEFTHAATLLNQGEVDFSAVGHLEGALAAFSLGYNVRSAAKNLGGIIMLFNEIGARHVLAGTAKLSDPKVFRETWDWIKKYAPELRARYEGSALKLVTPRFGDTAGMLGRARFMDRVTENPMALLSPSVWKEHALDWIQFCDYTCAFAAIHAARSEVMSEKTGLTGDDLQNEIGRRATLAIARTQNPANPIDNTIFAMKAKRSVFARAGVMFRSQSMKNANNFLRHLHAFMDSDKRAGDYATLITKAGVIVASSYIVGQLVKLLWGQIMDLFFGSAPQKKQALSPVADHILGLASDISDAVPFWGTFMRQVEGRIRYGDMGVSSGSNPLDRLGLDAADILAGLSRGALDQYSTQDKIKSLKQQARDQVLADQKLRRIMAQTASVAARFIGVPGGGTVESIWHDIAKREAEPPPAKTIKQYR